MAELSEIPGWFEPADVALFRWFLGEQSRLDAPGDLAELGVFMGKSAVVIGQHVAPGEQFTVVDLFEATAEESVNSKENSNTYQGLTQSQFERNYLAFFPTLPRIVRGESASIVDHVLQGSHRFVHVDASHLYAYVAQDVLAARTVLRPNGIVVFDDIRSVHTPGVWAAVWEAVVTLGLQPLAVTSRKFYGTWGTHGVWHERLLRLPAPIAYEVQQIIDWPVVRAWVSPPEQAALIRHAKDWLPPAIARQVAPIAAAYRRRRRSIPS